MRRRVLAVTALCALGVAAPAAGDGGPPQGGVQGWDGLARNGVRYVAVPTPGWTSVQVIKQNGGRLLKWMNVKGSWGIPIVTIDSPGDAMLRDNRTLILGEATAGPVLRKHSSFAFVDVRKLRVVRRIRLAGHFTFDAISPEARYLYLTEYFSPSDFALYRVRVYDLKAGRLLKKVVSDRSSWETGMRGWPISRVNRDGWAFTLYATGGRPFIHALDTRHAEAVCIDLPWKTEPKYMWNYRVRLDGDGHLVVRGRHGRVLLTVRKP
jgi:hypothetical protein